MVPAGGSSRAGYSKSRSIQAIAKRSLANSRPAAPPHPRLVRPTATVSPTRRFCTVCVLWRRVGGNRNGSVAEGRYGLWSRFSRMRDRRYRRTGSTPHTPRSATDARSRDRRRRPQPDRARVQGVAGPAAPERPPPTSSTSCWSATPTSTRRRSRTVMRLRHAQGLQAFNIARTVSLLSEAARDAPGRPSRATAPRASTRSATPRTRSRPARVSLRRRGGRVRRAASTRHRARRRRRPATRTYRRERPAQRLHRHGPDRRERREEVRGQPRRHGQDAQRSQELAVASQEDGFFDREIVPVDGPRTATRSPRTTARARRRPSRSSPSSTRPSGGGGVTAGDSCPLNDGAAAVLVMSDTKAKELGLTPKARLITRRHLGQRARVHGVAPIGRSRRSSTAPG